jgi:hypothetical protein
MRVGLAAALGMAGLVGSLAGASHTVFDFRVDRFEIDGGRGSEPDGVPDIVEEFDSPPDMFDEWRWVSGSTSVEDGFLHLGNPGSHIPDAYGAFPGQTIDISQIGFATDHRFGRRGSFRARAFWDAVVLNPGDYMHFTFVGSRFGSAGGGIIYEAVSMAVHNGTVEGEATTYDFTQALTNIPSLDDGPPVRPVAVAVDPAEITGQVVLELSFDDATDSVMGAFSLDGGETFHEPFRPQPMFRRTDRGFFLLGADPAGGGPATNPPAAPPPAPTCTRRGMISRARIAQRVGEGAFRLRATFEVSQALAGELARSGMELAIVQGQGPATVLRAPRGVPGAGCHRRDGWTTRGAVARYRNASGVFAPVCLPTTVRVLRRVRIDTRTGRISIRSNALPRAAVGQAGGVGVTVVVVEPRDAALLPACAAHVDCRRRGRALRCR